MRLPLGAHIVAVLLLSNPAFAQTRLEFETVKTSGAIPELQEEVSLSSREIFGFSMDPMSMRLHWVFRDRWHQLDLRSGEWTLQAIWNEFDLVDPRWGVVPGKSEIRAWDNAVGRVVRIDANGIPTRIDRSFDQKSQYGHISHVETNGSIHAIGGVGLFHPKNYSVTFSETSSGWHRTSANEDITSDPYVTQGYALRDPKTSTLILATAYGIAEYPRTPGLLSMDVKTGTIRILHPEMKLKLQQAFKGDLTALKSSVGDGSHRIAFFLVEPVVSEINRISRILAMDLDTYRIIELEGANQGDTDPGTHHTVLHYNEADSSLYSVQWSHHTMDMVHFPAVSKAKVDVAAIQAALKKGTPPVKSATAARGHMPLWPWMLAIVGVLVGWIGCRWKRRRPSPSPAPLSENLNGTPSKLRLSLNPLRLDDRPWISHFGDGFPLEGQLLDVLSRAHIDGQPIVSSDTVDRLLIPNHPSLDYIRKTRNLTRKRLEESLQNLCPLPSGECYILTYRDITDKRKTKLQLNPRWVEITPTE